MARIRLTQDFPDLSYASLSAIYVAYPKLCRVVKDQLSDSDRVLLLYVEEVDISIFLNSEELIKKLWISYRYLYAIYKYRYPLGFNYDDVSKWI